MSIVKVLTEGQERVEALRKEEELVEYMVGLEAIFLASTHPEEPKLKYLCDLVARWQKAKNAYMDQILRNADIALGKIKASDEMEQSDVH